MPQIDHVICPVDLTDFSTRPLAYAVAWSRWHDARLHVVHVAPLQVVAAPLAGIALALDQRPLELVRRDVERFVEQVPHEGVTLDIHVFEGDPPGFIRTLAEQYPRAMIVMGSHGRTGLERLVMGSVAERVVGAGIAPTLVVPPHDAHAPGTPPACKRILCAVDLLPSSLEGLRYALLLAREVDANLEVVHVIEEPGADSVQTTQHFLVPEYLRYRADEALEDLRARIPDEAREGCTILERVIFGRPADAVLQQAREIDADLIVLGTGDRSHIRSLWLGSTTSRIAHDAACPLLIVPTPSVLPRALLRDIQPIARERWLDVFERVSLRHQGDKATLTVLTPGFAAPEARELPFIGVSMDPPPAADVAMILGSPDGSHITHVVARPAEVLLDESHTHAVTRLLIRAADGTSTLLEVARRKTSPIEAMAEARLQL